MFKVLSLISLIFCFCLFSHSINAQGKQSYWTLRGGYLRSFVTASEPTIPSPNLYQSLGLSPINSYYVGVAYVQKWSKLGFSLGLNLQRKGMKGIDISQTARTVPNNDYYYGNFSPLIHYSFSKNAYIQLGPEVNFLLTKNSAFAYSKPVEIGGIVRLGYAINRIDFQVGVSHGFTPYSVSKFTGKDVFVLRNTTLQVGIAYKVKSL